MVCRPLGGKERIKRHHACNLRKRDIQRVRDHLLNLDGQVAVNPLGHVQHLDQTPLFSSVLRRQLSDSRKQRSLAVIAFTAACTRVFTHCSNSSSFSYIPFVLWNVSGGCSPP